MRRYILAIIIGLTCLISLCGCGNRKETESENVTVTETETEYTDNASNEEIYLEFIKNNGVVSVDEYNDAELAKYEYYEPIFESGKEYTFSDFLNKCLSYYYESENAELFEVSYVIIDCGMDNIPELAIWIKGMNFIPDIDSQVQFIIKEKDGKLQLTETLESVYRSIECLENKYGLCYSGGSLSAYEHSDGYDFLGADGKKMFGWSAETDYSFGDADSTYSRLSVAASNHIDEIENGIYSVKYHFEQYNGEDWQEYEAKGVYTLQIPDGMKDSEKLFDKGSVYRTIFEEAGAKLYTPQEIEMMKKEKMKKLGVLDTVLVNEELEWITLSDEELYKLR